MIRAAAAAASRACSLKFSVSTPIDFIWDTTLNGGAGAWPTTPTSDTRFVYDGWNVILELDALNSNAVQRKFTWGLDLSGTRQGAGGIGGLLAVEDHSGGTGVPPVSYLYFHDANGNVGQLIDWAPIADWQSLGLSSANDWHASRLAARYEYDAYGNSLLDPSNVGVSGAYAASNPFRFSTKYCEGDLDASATSDDLYYYGYRYYRPELGRWVSRDPIGESVEINLNSFVLNNPVSNIDLFGLEPDSDGPLGDEIFEEVTVSELVRRILTGTPLGLTWPEGEWTPVPRVGNCYSFQSPCKSLCSGGRIWFCAGVVDWKASGIRFKIRSLKIVLPPDQQQRPGAKDFQDCVHNAVRKHELQHFVIGAEVLKGFQTTGIGVGCSRNDAADNAGEFAKMLHFLKRERLFAELKRRNEEFHASDDAVAKVKKCLREYQEQLKKGP